MIVHGPPGVGKSTFGASAPAPIFLAAEDGLEEIQAAAVEPHPKTYEDVLAALDYVATLDRKTLVLDSLDWLEPLVWDHVIRGAAKKSIKSIEDFGYGKGYIAALDPWRVIIKKLEFLRTQGMHVILIAHSIRKTFKNPLGDDYEQFTIKLHDKATALFVEWARIIAFCEFDVATHGDEDKGERVKALATGRRILRAIPDPAFLAKSRTVHPLPAKLPLERIGGWDVFAKALIAAGDETDEATIIALTQQVEERVRALGDAEVEGKVRDFIKTNGPTAATLSEAVERLDITINARKAS